MSLCVRMLNVAVLRFVAVGLLSAFSLAANANSSKGAAKLSVPPIGSLINVGPVIGLPGVEREIVVTGVWPNGCVPQDAVVTDSGNLIPTIVVTLALPLTLQPCTLATAPYTVRTRYTPRFAGVTKIIAVTNTGQFVAESQLVTSELTSQRALFDVSGVWYNPDVPGWGLSFTHNFAGSGVAFGTWYVYRPDGSPRWYTLQDIKWDVPVLRGDRSDPPVPQIMTATVYETEGAECPANVAPLLIEACLVNAKTVRNVGRMTITFTSFATGAIVVERPPALLFQSLGRIVRMSF